MDDKTTKIPSLKEFQKTQQEYEKRDRMRRTSKVPQKNKSLKGDTHRVELKQNERKPSPTDRDIKIRESRPERPSQKRHLSGSTQKIDTRKVREEDERFKAFSGDTEYKRRPQKEQSHRDVPLTQRRVAGERPQGYQVNQRPPQRPGAPSQRPPQHPSQRPPQGRPPQGRPNPQVKHAPKDSTRVYHKKKKKPLSPFARKVRRIAVYALIIFAILIVGCILSMTVLFKTENIVVSGADNLYSPQDIISASGLHYQDNIIMAQKHKAEKKLEEKFPYIKSAEVYAVFPDTINIDITLSTASFAVKTDKLTYIANEDSKVLQVTSTADEVKVPLIEGVQVKDAKAGERLEFESQLVLNSITEMFNLAKEKGYKNITKVDVVSTTSPSGTQTVEIRYVYDDRIVVFLGIPENISYKMQTAQTIITEKLDVNGAVLTGELDVSNSYDTKRSYFNQYSLIPQVEITQPSSSSTEAATEVTTLAEEYYEEPYNEDYYADEGDYYEDENADYIPEEEPAEDYYSDEGEEVYW